MLYKRLFLIFLTASLIGCQSIMQENVSQEKLTEQPVQIEEIESYFVSHLAETAFGGRAFCAIDVLATEQKDGDIM